MFMTTNPAAAEPEAAAGGGFDEATVCTERTARLSVSPGPGFEIPSWTPSYLRGDNSLTRSA